MARFLDTRGRSTLGIGICGRCSIKMSLDDLYPDPNSPGLYVCQDDLDGLDRYRLPARAPDQITLDHPRPDVSLTDEGPTYLFGLQALDPIYQGAHLAAAPITQIRQPRPWQPRTWYNVGDTVTPQNVDDQNVDLPQRWFVVLQAGLSGDVEPDWPDLTGIPVGVEQPVPPVTGDSILWDDGSEVLWDDGTSVLWDTAPVSGDDVLWDDGSQILWDDGTEILWTAEVSNITWDDGSDILWDDGTQIKWDD